MASAPIIAASRGAPAIPVPFPHVRSYDDVMSGQTGVQVSSNAEWEERRDRHDAQDAVTAEVARALAAGGIDPFRPGEGYAIVGLVSGAFKPTEQQYRRSLFLPAMAASLRAGTALELELFLSLHAPYARYGVITTGTRCPVCDVRARVVKLERLISQWRYEVCAPLGIEVYLRSIELPSNQDLTFHVHANVLYQPTRRLGQRRWRRFLRQTRAFFAAHWRDNGGLEDVREVVKYVMKADQLLWLTRCHPGVLVQLHDQLQGLHLVQPLGPFKAWRRGLEDAHQKVIQITEDEQRKLIAVQRPRRRPRDETEPSPGPRLPRTNRVLAFCLPRAVFGPHKEPVVLVSNLDLDTLWHDPIVMEHAARALHAWTSKGLPPPARLLATARSASTVHTSTTTVGAAMPYDQGLTPEKAAAYGHPP